VRILLRVPKFLELFPAVGDLKFTRSNNSIRCLGTYELSLTVHCFVSLLGIHYSVNMDGILGLKLFVYFTCTTHLSS
jgi:hypothetical protein